MAISAADFDYVRRLVRDLSAIVLDPGKEYLVESRLMPLARQEGFPSLQDLVARVRSEPINPLHRRVVEVMTTNETWFFRDLHPFEALRKTLLPDLIFKRGSERRLNIWCAACSSGQEPYTVAMVLREYFPQLASWTVRILATDISKEILARARAGRFSQLEINRGLPAPLLIKYFQKQGYEWQISDQLRHMVEYSEINLAEAWPLMAEMDIIFLRNVLIYFDVETKKAILGRVRRVMKPDGYLLLGGAETTLNLDDQFERMDLDRVGCYRIRSRAPAPAPALSAFQAR